MTPRRFTFDSEPAPPAVPTAPVPPAGSTETALLGAFVPPVSALPFRTAPPDPVATELVGPLVLPPPPRVPARSRAPWRTATWSLLLLVDLVVLVYLIATWQR
jgi:hypothetical protein